MYVLVGKSEQQALILSKKITPSKSLVSFSFCRTWTKKHHDVLPI